MKKLISRLKSVYMPILQVKTEQIQREGYTVHLVRTQREKSVSIKIEKGIVAMFVPNDLPMKEINQVLEEKHSWIIEKLAIHPEIKPKEYVSGERFLYLGKSYSLVIKYGNSTAVKLTQDQLLVTIPSKKNQAHEVKKAIYYWYRENAEKIIREKVSHYENIVGVQADEIRFKLFKHKWGCCDLNRCIDFNWFIILAPNHIVDYVVVHELTHLVYFSHSPKFWKEIEQVIPDYQKCEDWLRDYGQTLIL